LAAADYRHASAAADAAARKRNLLREAFAMAPDLVGQRTMALIDDISGHQRNGWPKRYCKSKAGAARSRCVLPGARTPKPGGRGKPGQPG
jgi:hypothetical protein